jgi:hypothetical protein
VTANQHGDSVGKSSSLSRATVCEVKSLMMYRLFISTALHIALADLHLAMYSLLFPSGRNPGAIWLIYARVGYQVNERNPRHAIIPLLHGIPQ